MLFAIEPLSILRGGIRHDTRTKRPRKISFGNTPKNTVEQGGSLNVTDGRAKLLHFQ